MIHPKLQDEAFLQDVAQARSLVSGRDQVLAVTPSLQPAWLAQLHQLNRGRRGQAGVLGALEVLSSRFGVWVPMSPPPRARRARLLYARRRARTMSPPLP